MNRRTLARLAVAPFVLGLLAACSAAPGESTGTAEQDIWVHSPPPKYPAPPAWPDANATFCPTVDAWCTYTVEPYSYQPRTYDAQLQIMGCTPVIRYYPGNGNGVLIANYAVCWDTPDVRATFPVVDWANICTKCLPMLPSGQVYVVTGNFAVGPNCPSGCPANGGTGHTSGGGGTVGASK